MHKSLIVINYEISTKTIKSQLKEIIKVLSCHKETSYFFRMSTTQPTGLLEIIKVQYNYMTFIGVNNVGRSKAYTIYSCCIYALIYFYYPLSLVLGIFSVAGSIQDFLENLALITTVIVCSIKIAMYHSKLGSFKETGDLFNQLDQNLSDQEALELTSRCKKISQPLFWMYLMVFLSSIVSILFFKERRLLYPAWFPVDWTGNDFIYFALIVYQIGGIGVLIIANFVSDSLPSVLIKMLTCHLELLYQRVASVGWDKKRNAQADLSKCIHSHKIILELHHSIKKIIHIQIFLQCLVSALALCSTIVLLAFFVKDSFQRIYFVAYLMSMLAQVFVVCFYGSYFNSQINELTTGIYFCNWMDQDETFKRTLRIFMEGSLRRTQFSAAGFFYISITTFVAIVRASYSYYAILSRAVKQI